MQTLHELGTTFDAFGWLETVVRLVLAITAGAVLGWERERLGKPAGLRTHMMVALGSASFMLASIQLGAQIESESSTFRSDPTRTLAGIIGGIGFLGAGTIIEARGAVQGITTAASIWVVAAIGVACGSGLYQIAVTTVFLAFLVLTVIGYFERKAFDADGHAGDS